MYIDFEKWWAKHVAAEHPSRDMYHSKEQMLLIKEGARRCWNDLMPEIERLATPKASLLLEFIEMDYFLNLRSQAISEMSVKQYSKTISDLYGYEVRIIVDIDERKFTKRSISEEK